MKLISVIVPVYNVEKYVKKCVDSILNQDYENYEIIIVDDGSTDNSYNILTENYKDNDKVSIYQKENGGLSSARNFGLEKSKGEYVCFVDSDDIIAPFYLSHLCKMLEDENADIAIGKYQTFTNEISFNLEKEINIFTCSNNEAQMLLLENDYVNFVIACNKLYKKSLFDIVTFAEGKINEDEAIMYKLFYYSKKIVYSNQVIYGYYMRQGSITKRKFSTKNYDFLEIAKEKAVFFQDKDLYIWALNQKNYCLILVDYALRTKEILKDKKGYKNLIKQYRKEVKPLLKNKFIAFKTRLSFVIVYVFPALYYFLVKINKKIKGDQ